jgi:hypothetical protein
MLATDMPRGAHQKAIVAAAALGVTVLVSTTGDAATIKLAT